MCTTGAAAGSFAQACICPADRLGCLQGFASMLMPFQSNAGSKPPGRWATCTACTGQHSTGQKSPMLLKTTPATAHSCMRCKSCCLNGKGATVQQLVRSAWWWLYGFSGCAAALAKHPFQCCCCPVVLESGRQQLLFCCQPYNGAVLHKQRLLGVL